uniref:Uncharacterized protein n=1 Tax=Anguilla anguilla TaxID=7936 RepID=A0A0E9QWU9_ANGAN
MRVGRKMTPDPRQLRRRHHTQTLIHANTHTHTPIPPDHHHVYLHVYLSTIAVILEHDAYIHIYGAAVRKVAVSHNR